MICIKTYYLCPHGYAKCGCDKCIFERALEKITMPYRRFGLPILAPYTQEEHHIMYKRMLNYTEKLKAMPKLTSEQYKAIEQIIDYRLAMVTFNNQEVYSAVHAALRDIKTLAPIQPQMHQYLGGKKFTIGKQPSQQSFTDSLTSSGDKKIPPPAPGDGRFSS